MMKSFTPSLIILIIVGLLLSCHEDKKLPILGTPKIVNGVEQQHSIPDFSFINQNGEQVTEKDFEDKIYVADFFFTTCTTICPTVMSQMIRIYDKYENNPNVRLLSHTLDPQIDSIHVLKNYADNLEVQAPKWHLVTGPKKEIRSYAKEYMNIVVDDPEAPGGINHSGKIVLVDKARKVRSYAEGTDPLDVDKLIADIELLLAEYEN